MNTYILQSSANFILDQEPNIFDRWQLSLIHGQGPRIAFVFERLVNRNSTRCQWLALGFWEGRVSICHRQIIQL